MALLAIGFFTISSIQAQDLNSRKGFADEKQKLETEMALTEAQQSKMLELKEIYIQKIKDTRVDKSVSAPDRMKIYEKAKEEYEAGVKALMSEEQYANYQKIQNLKMGILKKDVQEPIKN